MQKSDWKDAPDWANILVKKDALDDWVVYCWASEFKRGAKALWVGDSEGQEFELWPDVWLFVENRPS